MITVAIALFLIGGLLTITQNVRQTYLNQQALSQLQDEQRFAMTVITDVIQTGSYFPDALAWVPATSLPARAAYVGGQPPFATGQAFTGSSPGALPDTLSVRYRTAINDGVLLCDGSTNTAIAPSAVYTNNFTVVLPNGGVPGMLMCGINAANARAIVYGVQGMQIFYGVKRNFALNDYNVDTYLTAPQMNAGGPNGGDWANLSTVLVRLTFTNPLYVAPGRGQLPTLVFERVVEVMGRAGVHT